ncbi:MAG: hypothetical protein EZS28_038088 [Streblomastix strix]|uniref:Uncharacterized protein n=1 Tax=Streblomastix strix TaxID=222440 RepID=A0A5J4U710_9EUKA|nr:MAG: hypothetical protein EZS28_038088 [Streblomastix strix]
MTQASGQNAQALLTHLRDGAGLNTTPRQLQADDRDANVSDTNIFASDRDISVTDADAGGTRSHRFLSEFNRTGADTGLQSANFARTRGDKTRRSATAPNLEHGREQPRGRIHSEFVISNLDAVQAYYTINSTCSGREHEKDID